MLINFGSNHEHKDDQHVDQLLINSSRGEGVSDLDSVNGPARMQQAVQLYWGRLCCCWAGHTQLVKKLYLASLLREPARGHQALMAALERHLRKGRKGGPVTPLLLRAAPKRGVQGALVASLQVFA